MASKYCKTGFSWLGERTLYMSKLGNLCPLLWATKESQRNDKLVKKITASHQVYLSKQICTFNTKNVIPARGNLELN